MKELKEKKDVLKKLIVILKNFLCMKKLKDFGFDGNVIVFNKRNILKKMRYFNDVISDRSNV